MQHILQPKHIKLKKEETDKLLKKYNVTKEQLPKIKINDPGLEGLNVEKGDVIKILRKSGEKEVEYFRLVI
ncbi:DNA-directed RNA polymerase subunit H [Candidatus Pacearchaeota archaeon ex4484_26]|nr:MAG: DNA-directed RNA polymerase subunit H [Candidatus Pacearchaeota archaeon ex4484_26]